VESSAAVVGDRIYVGSSDAVRLYALDRATGEKQWEYSTVPNWAWSSPAVADGVVYIGSNTIAGASASHTCRSRGCFHAVDINTHLAKWQILTGESLDDSHMNGVVSSPVIASGVVYFGGMDGRLYAASTAP
jgi:outer membrane protein assembly factor BamB